MLSKLKTFVETRRRALLGAVLVTCAAMVAATWAKADTIPSRTAAPSTVTRAEAAKLVPYPSWTGCYAGGALKHVNGTTDSWGVGVDGYAMGGIVGCDLQIGNIVLGGFGDYDWGHVSQFGGISYKEWSFGGRAGVVVAPTVLIYALANRPQIQYSGNSFNGLGVGGGVEVQLTKNWATALEYRHETFDTIAPVNVHVDTIGARLTFRVDVPKLQ